MRYRALITALVAVCLSVLTACSEGPSAGSDLLTYDQIVGTGLANNCPQLQETSRGAISIDSSKSYRLKDLCLQPTEYLVKEESSKRRESAFVPGKPLTRYTTTIDQVEGSLSIGSDGSLTFNEEDGLDFQPTTVLLPGGEQVPFLFTIKGLVAQTQPGIDSINTSTDFEGSFKVPGYRTANFLDPKGRGLASGYDNAVALPAQADSGELSRENTKNFRVREGNISLQVAKVDPVTGEVAGTFVSIQPSDTDMEAKDPVDVKIRGLFYARVEAS